MNSNCLLATIYHRFGIDISRHFIDNTGRPVPVLTDGEAIGELVRREKWAEITPRNLTGN